MKSTLSNWIKQARIILFTWTKTKRILTAIFCGALGLFAMFLLYRTCLADTYVLHYQKTGEGQDWKLNQMQVINYPERYLPYYNRAVEAYEAGRYEEAIADGYKAMKGSPSLERDCPIRINLALSLLKIPDFDAVHAIIDREDAAAEQGAEAPERTDEERKLVDNTIVQLMTARQILIEHGCAHSSDEGGHNADAQQLKDEIDRELERLHQEPPQDQEQNQEQEEQSQGSQGQSSREKQLQKQLNDRKEEAKKEQSDYQNDYNDRHPENQGGSVGDGEDQNGGGESGEDGDSGPVKNW